MNTSVLFGERSLTLVGAAFGGRDAAEQAATVLRQRLTKRDEVVVVAPDDQESARKFEPEQAGIWRTALRSHTILGVAGLTGGAVAGLVLAELGWQAAHASPGYAALFCGALGGFIGLMAAGLLTLRPDHGVVVRRLRAQMKSDRWLVVAHPRSEADAGAARQMLEAAGGETQRSI